MLTKTLRTLMVATCLTGLPALALAQDGQPPKHSAPEYEEPVPAAAPALGTTSTTPSFGVYAHFGIGGIHNTPVSGLGLLAGVSARVGPVFIQGNALDVAVEPGTGLGFDYVDDGGVTVCEDSDGDIFDDAICDGKTPSITRRAASIDASMFVPHTSMLVGVGDRFDHGSQTVYGSVGYVFSPDDERNSYVLNVSAGDHFFEATIGIAVPLFTR
jgi:hypothetical protein